MSVQKVVGVLVAILVVFWIVSSPTTAAGPVNNVLSDLASAGQSVIVFLHRGVSPAFVAGTGDRGPDDSSGDR